MREIAQPFCRVADAGSLEAVEDLPARGLFAHAPVQGQHLVKLFFQRMQRVE